MILMSFMKFLDIDPEIDSRHKIAESVEHSNSENPIE